jgi:hypothetical protein
MEDYTAKKMRAARTEKANETARKMIADGMATEMIAKYSGLTVAEVETLAKENN